jgi:hypothetical protein
MVVPNAGGGTGSAVALAQQRGVASLLEGPMVVETRAPREIFELRPGGTCVVPAKRAHRVTGKNGGPCKFGVLQGVGVYDFNPVGS